VKHTIKDKQEIDGHIKKIENSEQEVGKSTDMASTTQIKNMSDALLIALEEIFKTTLNEKYAKKAIKALSDPGTSTALAKIIEDNMPTSTKTKTKTKTSSKKPTKDPDAPKRGCSSYIFFCKEKRDEVKQSNPGFKGTDVTKELGRIWREQTSEDDKKPYIDQASADKERYLAEMLDYTPSGDWVKTTDTKKTKNTKKKTNTGPKRARSSYIFFCTEMRAQVKQDNDDMDAKEITSEMGRLWREDYKDDEEMKERFTTMAANDKKRFEQEKTEWDNNSSDEDKFTPKAKKSSKKKDLVEEDTDTDEEPTKKSKKSSKKKDLVEEEPTKKSKKSSKKKDLVEEDTEEEPTKKSKKSSKKKDLVEEPTKKIKSVSAYTIFCQRTRSSMRQEQPSLSMGQITDRMEKLWKTMDDDEKNMYIE
jgi:hypothetical protein